MSKILHKLFPSPVFQFKIENFESLNKQLSEYIYDLKKNDEQGIQRSNVNGWHSQNFKVEKGNVPYNFIKSIHTHVKEVIVEGFGWKYIPSTVYLSKLIYPSIDALYRYFYKKTYLFENLLDH